MESSNSDTEVAKVNEALKQISIVADGVVAVMDHFGKDPERGARGSSAKPAGVDAELHIIGKKGQMNGLVLRSEKVRGGPRGWERTFDLKEIVTGVDEDGHNITTCTVELSRSSGPPTEKKLPRNLELLVRAIADLAIERTQPRPHIWVTAVEESKLKEEYYARYTAQEEKKPGKHRNSKYEAFKKALIDGVTARIIDKQEYGERSSGLDGVERAEL